MALENYRITEFQEKTQVDNGDYVLIDSATDGTHKYQLSRIPAQASAEVDAAVAAEKAQRQAADAELAGDIGTLSSGKVDKVAGKGLSTNDFTDALKTKLEGIEAGAEVNDVTSVAGKTGAVTLDGGDVSYSDESTYAEGTVGAAVAHVKSDLTQIEQEIAQIGSGLSDEAKEALLACFEHVAWVDDDGQDYYDALEEALNAEHSRREELFGAFTAGISVIKSDHVADSPHYNDYVCIRQSVAARACIAAPIPNKNYVFTVTDSTKYNLLAYPVTDLTKYPTSSTAYYDNYAYLSTDKTMSWSASASATTKYVWIALKKMDGTDFTAEELANGAEAVFNYTSVDVDDVEITSGMTLVNQDGKTYRMQNSTTTARACFRSPVYNDNYTFTVTDSTKYSLTARDILSLDATEITWSGNVDGIAYPTGGTNTSWVTSGSASTPFVWLSLKKNDGTEFTAAELANHGAAIYTYSKGE